VRVQNQDSVYSDTPKSHDHDGDALRFNDARLFLFLAYHDAHHRGYSTVFRVRAALDSPGCSTAPESTSIP